VVVILSTDINEVENEENYSVKKYRTPDGAPADIVIFTITTNDTDSHSRKRLPDHGLKVLLIKRKNWPHAGKWAVPGGFSNPDESLEDTAARELQEETSVNNIHLEYFNQYSTPRRDERGWIISHAFFAIVPECQLKDRVAADDAEEVELIPYADAINMELAFDHNRMLVDAYEKLKKSMLQTDIAKHFLPEAFTLAEMIRVIQAVVPDFNSEGMYQRLLSSNKRNGILESVIGPDGNVETSTKYSQRPAILFKFTGYVPVLSIYG
jgi:8-oxo-dGTP diphosphatase